MRILLFLLALSLIANAYLGYEWCICAKGGKTVDNGITKGGCQSMGNPKTGDVDAGRKNMQMLIQHHYSPESSYGYLCAQNIMDIMDNGDPTKSKCNGIAFYSVLNIVDNGGKIDTTSDIIFCGAEISVTGDSIAFPKNSSGNLMYYSSAWCPTECPRILPRIFTEDRPQ
jgi:hypothetical protein